jgi:hypothetical protein
VTIRAEPPPAEPPAEEQAPRVGRVPPHSVEAEESLLGSMLLSRAAVEVGLQTLRPDDFYLPVHARIFAAITDLARHGTAADPTLVATWLGDHDPTPPIARKVIAQIQAATPSSANAVHYAKIVVAASSRRRLAAAGRRILDLAWDNDIDAATAVERAHEQLARAELPLGGQPSPDVGSFLAESQELRWVWPNILAESERLLIVAPEKFGKSTLIRQIAVLLAQGLDPWRLTTIPTACVLLIDLENPPGLVRRKIAPIFGAANTLGRQARTDTLRIECRPEGINIVDRADLLWLHDRIAGNLAEWARHGYAGAPFVLAIGPVYKLHENEISQEEVRKVQRALDAIRTRYGCALIMETHAPHESFASKAPPHSLRPAGPRTWLRWPEFCRAIEPYSGVAAPTSGPNDLADFYDVQGARDERAWPYRLRRGGRYPWLDADLSEQRRTGDPDEIF